MYCYNQNKREKWSRFTVNKMTKRAIGGISIAAIVALLVVPLPFGPPGDTRIIVDHTLRTYIAPSCFNQAEVTNHLSELTWTDAQQRGYAPESACTSDALQPVRTTIIGKTLQNIGVLPSPWR